MGVNPKTFWIGMAVLFVILFALWEPDQFEASARSAVLVIVRMAMLAIAAVLVYQAFDHMRAGWRGVNPKSSKPEGDPSVLSARLGSVLWGLLSAVMGVSLAAFALGFFGPLG